MSELWGAFRMFGIVCQRSLPRCGRPHDFSNLSITVFSRSVRSHSPATIRCSPSPCSITYCDRKGRQASSRSPGCIRVWSRCPCLPPALDWYLSFCRVCIPSDIAAFSGPRSSIAHAPHSVPSIPSYRHWRHRKLR